LARAALMTARSRAGQARARSVTHTMSVRRKRGGKARGNIHVEQDIH